jgi:hypothetical protein
LAGGTWSSTKHGRKPSGALVVAAGVAEEAVATAVAAEAADVVAVVVAEVAAVAGAAETVETAGIVGKESFRIKKRRPNPTGRRLNPSSRIR